LPGPFDDMPIKRKARNICTIPDLFIISMNVYYLPL